MSAGSTPLTLFSDLAAPEPDKRQKAASSLLASLRTEQEQHSSGPASARSQQDGQWAPSLDYALKRLLRGLASSRGGARQGFSTALSEILRALDVVDTESFCALADKLLVVGQNANRQVRAVLRLLRVLIRQVALITGEARLLLRSRVLRAGAAQGRSLRGRKRGR
jgi:DNA polymerase phi